MTIEARTTFFGIRVKQGVAGIGETFHCNLRENWLGNNVSIPTGYTIYDPDHVLQQSDRSVVNSLNGARIGQPLKRDETTIIGKDRIKDIVIPSRIPGLRTTLRWTRDPEETPSTCIEDEELPYLTGEIKPRLSTELMEAAQEWAKDNPQGELKLFAVQDVYSGDESVKARIMLSSYLQSVLLKKGLTFPEIEVQQDAVLETELAELLKKLTKGQTSGIRTSKSDRRTAMHRTTIKNVMLRKESSETKQDFTFFSLQKAR